LLVAFFFNLAGYYALFEILSYQANRELQQHLDANDYADNETVMIKIPITLPYQPSQTEFERIAGGFEYRGEFYKLVKQRLESDTLSVVCIKDNKEKALVVAMSDFAKLSNDLPATSTTLKIIGSFLKEYDSANDLKLIGFAGWSLNIFFRMPPFLTLAPVLPVHNPPPEFI
jgi:hypothetical protein